jgi:hypothetical protein
VRWDGNRGVRLAYWWVSASRVGVNVPEIDEATRQRLTARFGSEVEAWFAQLPGLLAAVAAQSECATR